MNEKKIAAFVQYFLIKIKTKKQTDVRFTLLL